METGQFLVPCPSCGDQVLRSVSSAGVEVTCRACGVGYRVPEGVPGGTLSYATPASAPRPAGYPQDATGKNLAQQMARGAWVAPLVAYTLMMCIRSDPMDGRAGEGGLMVKLIASFAFYAVGLGLGIAALAAMSRYGRRGVLVPAIVGICLCLLPLSGAAMMLLRRWLG